MLHREGMRWFAVLTVVACRTARPVEVPQTPSGSAAEAQGIVIDEKFLKSIPAQGIVIDEKFLDNIPAPWLADWMLDGGQAWMDSGVFGPVGLPMQPIFGRYYVDGIYVESRGPRFPIWH